jgi:hypothetical protein
VDGAEGADGADAAVVSADRVAGVDPVAAADVVDGRVNPGGVSGANPGALDADDLSAVELVELESAPDTDRDDAIEVAPALDAGRVAAIEGAFAEEAFEVTWDGLEGGGVNVCAVTVGAEVAPAVAAVTLPFSSGTALDPLRRDDCPPRVEVPRPLAAAEPFPFDGSFRCANKPSKNAKRGCDGAICRSLSTSVRAPLKSSALSADSVCATRSTTSCEYCGA